MGRSLPHKYSIISRLVIINLCPREDSSQIPPFNLRYNLFLEFCCLTQWCVTGQPFPRLATRLKMTGNPPNTLRNFLPYFICPQSPNLPISPSPHLPISPSTIFECNSVSIAVLVTVGDSSTSPLNLIP